MNYKQKYEEALKRAKYLKENTDGVEALDVSTCFEQIFPELHESEDEKWRKWLIGHLKGYINQTDNKYAEVCKKAIAWLEKQDEQKHINECNMHELTSDEVRKWNDAYEKGYSLGYKNGRNEQKPVEQSLPYRKNETAEKLIALAECLESDGDCLFNGLSGDDYGEFLRVLAKELTEIKPKFKVGDIISDGISEVEIVSIDENKYNVTNAEIENDANMCNWVIYFKDQENWKSANKSCSEENEKHPQLKQEWSEEDIRNIQDIDSILFYDRRLTEETCMRLRNFLESLKDRVQPKQEWSEEDDIRLDHLIGLTQKYGLNYYESIDKVIDIIHWLKSIKPNHWKPSEEQMEALLYALGKGGTYNHEALTQLYNNLKTL